MTAAEALAAAAAKLRAAGVADPARDARVLLAHAAKIDAARVTLIAPEDLSPDIEERFADKGRELGLKTARTLTFRSVAVAGEALGEASIIYAAPGYTADLRVEIATSDYEFTAEQQGWVAVLNDFHTGTDSGSAGRWMIDVAAVFLIVVSLTGLVLQFFLRYTPW